MEKNIKKGPRVHMVYIKVDDIEIGYRYCGIRIGTGTVYLNAGKPE